MKAFRGLGHDGSFDKVRILRRRARRRTCRPYPSAACLSIDLMRLSRPTGARLARKVLAGWIKLQLRVKERCSTRRRFLKEIGHHRLSGLPGQLSYE